MIGDLRACLKSVIRMLCCYKYSINPQKIFEILLNIPEIFWGFLENFSTQIIRSKILNRLLGLELLIAPGWTLISLSNVASSAFSRLSVSPWHHLYPFAAADIAVYTKVQRSITERRYYTHDQYLQIIEKKAKNRRLVTYCRVSSAVSTLKLRMC